MRSTRLSFPHLISATLNFLLGSFFKVFHSFSASIRHFLRKLASFSSSFKLQSNYFSLFHLLKLLGLSPIDTNLILKIREIWDFLYASLKYMCMYVQWNPTVSSIIFQSWNGGRGYLKDNLYILKLY